MQNESTAAACGTLSTVVAQLTDDDDDDASIDRPFSAAGSPYTHLSDDALCEAIDDSGPHHPAVAVLLARFSTYQQLTAIALTMNRSPEEECADMVRRGALPRVPSL